jgi:hypothetical protein
MTSLRRLMGLPRLPIRTYLLILLLFLVLAYAIAGPAHQFLAKLYSSSLGSFYEPKDLEREKYSKTIEPEKP